MSLKLQIAVNKSTLEIIGYTKPKQGIGFVFVGYSVGEVEKKYADFIKAQKRKEQKIEKTLDRLHWPDHR